MYRIHTNEAHKLACNRPETLPPQQCDSCAKHLCRWHASELGCSMPAHGPPARPDWRTSQPFCNLDAHQGRLQHKIQSMLAAEERNLKTSWLPVFWNKSKNHERLKRMFILITQHVQIFSENTFFKQQTDDTKLTITEMKPDLLSF